jgi:DNA-binding MarR family transcriptional regulator
MMASDQTNTRRRPATTVGAKKLLAVAALATELRDGVMRFNRRLRQARPVGDLTGSQLSVLSSLELAGALTPRELAESERVQPPTMTRVVARLESMGVVQRTPHPTDGRQVILSATQRGREALAENRRARDAWLTTQLAELSDAERDTLREAVEIMKRIARSGTPETPQR